jgi:hypothetical protein
MSDLQEASGSNEGEFAYGGRACGNVASDAYSLGGVPQGEPPSLDGVDAYWAYAAAEGIRTERIRALDNRLTADFRATDAGYASLDQLPRFQRAVVSDQILVGAQGAIRNLAEARLHERDIGGLIADGVPYAENTAQALERSTRIDLSFVGFFRGVGSALDCIAATAIGVLRLPLSIRRASFGRDLLSLSDGLAEQQTSWQEFRQLIVRHADDPPDWLDWTLEMRHAFMHRPRQMSILLPRDPEGPALWLPEPARWPALMDRLRFDPHLRRRPWLPDMQHLADTSLERLPEAVFGERATRTLRGCFEAANRLIEATAAFLLEKLDDSEIGNIPPPGERWELEQAREIDFEGFAPERIPAREYEGRINPHDEERIRLANELQREARRAQEKAGSGDG